MFSGGRRFHRGRQDPHGHIRRNHRIRASEIRVIGPDGKQVGVMPTHKALKIAQEAGLDLVEVAGTSNPPVCRIMDFGKFKYEESKKTKSSKPASQKLKEIELSVRIAENDYMTKIRHAEEFLDKGNKVKIRLKFRGREMAHTDIGFEVVNRAIKDLDHICHPDSEPRLIGRNINLMLTPHPVNKRKRKYVIEDEQPHDPDSSASTPTTRVAS